MLKQNISVKDQFGVQYVIQATVDPDFVHTQSDSNVKHITVEGENIRPSFEMFFQSTIAAKFSKLFSGHMT